MRFKETGNTDSSLMSSIRQIIAGKLQRDVVGIPGNKTLNDIGFDSLGLSDLAEAIDEHFNVKAPDRMFPGALTLDGLVSLVENMRKLQSDLTKQYAAEAAD